MGNIFIMQCSYFYRRCLHIFLLLVVITSCHTQKNETVNPFTIYAKSSQPKLIVPEKYQVPKPKKITHNNGDLLISLYARKFSQGNAIYLECIVADTDAMNDMHAEFLKKKILLARHSWGFSGLFAIPANSTPRQEPLWLYYKKNSTPAKTRIALFIRKTHFFVSHAEMDLGKYSDAKIHLIPENARFIKECTKKKRKAFKSLSPNYIKATLAHPRNMHYITSPFWATRIYKQFIMKNGKKIRRKSRIKIHRGLDLRGKEGTPVYALAAGKVVLADRMFYEGNMIIIDHGNKIFSYFMHLSSIHVKKGDIVHAGMRIADVGSTGISTASHLHVSLLINGIQADPLSLLSLPIRE
jgi:murein DD-endopeptidase